MLNLVKKYVVLRKAAKKNLKKKTFADQKFSYELRKVTSKWIDGQADCRSRNGNLWGSDKKLFTTAERL